MNNRLWGACIYSACALAALVLSSPAHAITFSEGAVDGSFVSTFTFGGGIRLKDPSCSITGAKIGGCSSGANTEQWSAGDDGNLNYHKGDFFSLYLKGTHELLLKFPDSWKFMVRGSYLYDFKADDTRRSSLSPGAKDEVVRDRRLLDLWVSKDFNIGEQSARVRVGNQVVNWGESLFATGGINVTNSLDVQRLSVPGTQVKEIVLPAPMISFATSIVSGLRTEAYYQTRWNRNRVPPIGSYFSFLDYFGSGYRQPVPFDDSNFNFTGNDAYTITGQRSLTDVQAYDALLASGVVFPANVLKDKEPKNQGQYGISFHYRPKGTSIDLGAYYINYHDKYPVLNLVNGGSSYQWEFLENRKLYGVSANFPVGNWAIGWELSYRPHDAVSLSACFNHGGPTDFNTNLNFDVNCPQYIDKEKYEMLFTALLQLNPSDHKVILDFLHAQTGFLSFEPVWIKYPGVSPNKVFSRVIDGVQVDQRPAAGYLLFFNRSNPSAVITGGGGTSDSFGAILDFNVTYDGSLIKGWQVTPGITGFWAISGDTPNFAANYLSGFKSANAYILFNQNPVVWQAGINYTKFWGGKDDPTRQFYKDRDLFGFFVAYNF